MPFTEIAGGRIYYEVAGPDTAPVLILSNSLGTNLRMWERQMPVFARQMQVIRYDTRGHGQSSIEPTPYSIDQLGRDVLALADSLRIDTFSFCGLSMGGLIGMWLGIHAGIRVRKLILCSMAAKIGTSEIWNTRIAAAKSGMPALAAGAMERWFTAPFREKSPETVDEIRKMVETTDPEGYAACCAAIRDTDFRAELSAIRVPTLVISGAHDPSTTPNDGHFLAEYIPGARYAELNAAHLSNIEDRENFTDEVERFLIANDRH
jgi:3-oxoadipate enol-lactonase